MDCDRCHKAMAPGEEEMFHGQTLREDCYMDAFSPTRTCDPWAVRSAMHCKDSEGGTVVTPAQEKILAILRETGAGPGSISCRRGWVQSPRIFSGISRPCAIWKRCAAPCGMEKRSSVPGKLRKQAPPTPGPAIGPPPG